MNTTTKVAVAAALLLTFGLSWWVMAPEPGTGTETGGGEREEAKAPPGKREVEPDAEPKVAAASPEILLPAKKPEVPPEPLPYVIGRDRLPLVTAVMELPPEEDRVDIEVDAQGRITAGGGGVDLAALREHLKERADGSREETGGRISLVNLVLRVDRDLPWQGAQGLMQACADPAVRIYRIHYAATPETGGDEGVLATFLPVDPGPGKEDPASLQEGSQPAGPPSVKLRGRTGGQMVNINVKLSRAGTGTPSSPRDLYPYLEEKFPDLRDSGFLGEIDAAPSVPTGDVLATVDVMRRSGMRGVVFRGTQLTKDVTLEAVIARVPPATGVIEITVLGVPLVPR